LRAQGYRAILPSDIAAHFKSGKPLPRRPVIITFDDGYLSALTVVEPILKANGFRAVMYLITGQTAATAADRHENCLIWPEVLAMQQRKTFVFGGHSHSHKNLAGDPDPWAQIAECRRQLRLHKIRKPFSFCYPYGQYNTTTMRDVRKAKFQTAVVCEDAVATIGPATNLFALPRVSVMGGNHDFKLLNKTADAKDGMFVCRLMHTGIPLEISACLRGEWDETWLPARPVAQGEFELRFAPADTGPAPEPQALEIWDKHRLFKLATINP